MLTNKCKQIAESSLFTNFITFVILVASVLVGAQTYPSLVEKHGGFFDLLDTAILAIFIAEVIIKIAAEGKKPLNYFKDPWNVFDFSIVAACLVPSGGSFVAVFRLIRILRVLRLITAIPKLQMLVGAILHSIPSIGYITMLLSLHFYVYAVVGTMMFGGNDPANFGTLHISLLSLFRVVTLEDWTDLMYTQMYGSDVYPSQVAPEMLASPEAMPIFAALYFITFIMFGTMIVMNLFIGVIINGMDEANDQIDEDSAKRTAAETQIKTIPEEIENLLGQLEEMRVRLEMVDTLLKDTSDVPLENGSSSPNSSSQELTST